MKRILVIGAGRSAVSLIKYLSDNAIQEDWLVVVADYSLETAKEAICNYSNCQALLFDVNNDKQRRKEIIASDIVVSMLPAYMHFIVAKDCVDLRKNLVTASYVSENISSLDSQAKDANIILLNEIGLDPGIDHMSAMQMIENIRSNQGEIMSFKSFCGGLIHPDFDNNPWNYKFTWNPRNVVLAGQGVAQYIEEGKYKYIPYNKLFERLEYIEILDVGEFEAYANRDSLNYRKSYKLDNVKTLLRGTLRKTGYSEAWNIFVQLGMTEDTYKLNKSETISNREFINMFLPNDSLLSVEEKLCRQFNLTINSEIYQKLLWLGLFSKDVIGAFNASPAQLLQAILENKWKLSSNDKDMIVMQHQFEYVRKGKMQKLNSSLVVYGDNPIYTAMAKTVGLPVAIAVKLILNNKISLKGVRIPIYKEIYDPILQELQEHGIDFVEELV